MKYYKAALLEPKELLEKLRSIWISEGRRGQVPLPQERWEL